MIASAMPWIIRDWRVFSLLREHGFACCENSPGWAGTWYTTNCPIEFNGSYVFPCGYVIRSDGTELVFAGFKQ